MAAAAVTLARGIAPEAVRRGLETFGGVKHRLEEVASDRGVVYVNDSKATNVDAAVTGLTSFPGGVHVILGGRGHADDLAPLVTAVRERAAGRTSSGRRPASWPTRSPRPACR
jgi:UDP-N-acetylmuramoylalanine--D-glutamate ligase